MRNYVTATAEELKTPYLVILGVVIGFFVLLWGMVELNTSGNQGWNIPIAIIGGIAIAAILLRPTFLVQSSIGGFIYAFFSDKDKSQGVVTGPASLGKFAFVLLYSFVLIAFTLATWSFARFHEGAWIVVVGVFLLIGAGYIFKGLEFGKVTPYIACGWVAICVLAALYMSLGTYAGRNFDPDTGAAQYMINKTTGQLDDLGRKPEDCVKPKKCVDQVTGEKLVPATTEYRDQLMQRSPQGLAGLAAIEAEKHSAAASSGSTSVLGFDLWTWVKWVAIILVVVVVLSLVFRRGGGAIIPIAVLATILIGGYWLWSTQFSSEAKAAEAGCESVQDVRILMGDYEDIELSRNCVASFDVTGLPIRDRGLRTQVAGEDAPSRFGRMHPVRRGGSGELIGWELRPHYSAGLETKTFRVSWRNSKEPSLPKDTSAPAEIDLEKAEAAIAIS